MSVYVIQHTDTQGKARLLHFNGSHKALLELVNKLQAAQPAGAPPVLWSKL